MVAKKHDAHMILFADALLHVGKLIEDVAEKTKRRTIYKQHNVCETTSAD